MSSNIQRKLFSVRDCDRMYETGILRPSERVELIRGEIILMMPTGPRHGAAVDGATRFFVRIAGDDAIVRVQGSVVLDEFCWTHPDVALLRPRADFYVGKNPAGADVLLIIEVADSSLEYDTSVKKEVYAILGVQEYWVADLRSNRLLVHRDPADDEYTSLQEFHRGDVIAPRLLPECRLPVDILLP